MRTPVRPYACPRLPACVIYQQLGLCRATGRGVGVGYRSEMFSLFLLGGGGVLFGVGFGVGARFCDTVGDGCKEKGAVDLETRHMTLTFLLCQQAR